MRLDEKARENLEAAERLLPDDDRDGLLNASASRSYYAAYHAVADCALENGYAFTRDDYFAHDRLPDDALRWGLLDDDGRDDLELLRGMRVKADYFEDQVEHEEACEAFEIARALMHELLGGAR